VRRRTILALLVLLIGAFALVAAGCGGDDDDGDAAGTQAEEDGEGGGDNEVEELPSAACQPVEYEGDGEPDVLITSDLPMQGSSRTQTVQMVEAIRFILNQRGWSAGGLDIGYQVCDDSTAQTGQWDTGKCNSNANEYAQNPDVVGMIGTFNSGCAAIEIPVLNGAPEGGVAMVSPANTYVCLTTVAPACEDTEPDQYYPSGARNYTRIVAHDAYQAAALATFMQDLGVESVFILNDAEAYGLGVAQNLRSAAEELGIEVAGFARWNEQAPSYEALYTQIENSGAQAVFLGGLIDENGAKLIRDKVAVLGPNVADPAEGVVLVAPDGFTTQATIDEAGEAAAGMYASVAGVPADQLTGTGAEFVSSFAEETGAATPLEPYTAYAAQAAEVLLTAIDESDGSRASIIEQMLAFETSEGIVASEFAFDENGDPTIGPVTVYVAEDSFATEEVITPDPALVEAALGG
jgi:branched-chain amino acid transport system substrate-binding protein